MRKFIEKLFAISQILFSSENIVVVKDSQGCAVYREISQAEAEKETGEVVSIKWGPEKPILN